jgi:hypothetical protein
MDVLWATDFFSTEVWTLGGRVTFYVLFFIKLDTREVHIAGITANPNEPWMNQMARNLTMEEWGILKSGQYLIHDGDKKFCASFKERLDNSGVKRVPLPPRSPWLNSFAERRVQSVKTEALSQMILFGERSLRHVLGEYVTHFHEECSHQGKGNVILCPTSQENPGSDAPIECRERLGGCLNTTTVRPHEDFDRTPKALEHTFQENPSLTRQTPPNRSNPAK